MTTPDFVVVGHVVKDLTPQGSRLGGAATFASVQAHRLGLSVGVVTRAGADALEDPGLAGIEFAGRSSNETTMFQNTYEASHRRQCVRNHAAPISEEDVPPAWRDAAVVLLGPVCGELPPESSNWFSNALKGVGAQGWLRELDTEHNVRPTAWEGVPFWQGCHMLFVSDEDMGNRRDQLRRWVAEVPIVVLTEERRGARVYERGSSRRIAAFPADEVDPTGAGDIFAAAFLVRHRETNDAAQAARFASSAAAFSVEAQGISGIATREQIEQRLSAHPDLVLQ